MLLAANLGEDANTTAAAASLVVGILYGASGTPKKWLGRLVLRDRIERAAGDLFDEGAHAVA